MTFIVKEIKRGCPPKKLSLKFWIVFDNGAWYSGEPHPPLSAMVSICHTPAPPLPADVICEQPLISVNIKLN